MGIHGGAVRSARVQHASELPRLLLFVRIGPSFRFQLVPRLLQILGGFGIDHEKHAIADHV